MIIDKLLSEYTDELNAGKQPDKKKFLRRCPWWHRKELSELLEITKTLSMFSDFMKNVNRLSKYGLPDDW